MSQRVGIKGLDKAEVLKALHDGTRVLGMGFLQARANATLDDFRQLGDGYADYVFGRPIKCNIDGDDFDPRLYDRDAGAGRAAEVIASLKASKANGASK